MHRTLLAFALVAAGAVCSAAAGPREPLRIYADYARFRGDNSTVYVEVYYAIPQTGLTFLPDSGGYRAVADVTVIAATPDSMVRGDRWLVPHVAKDTAAITGGMSLVGQTSLGLPPGQYSLTLIVRDRNAPGRIDSVRMKLPVAAIRTDVPALSDVELATVVRKGQKGSMFYKNTLEVLPNVQGLYAEDQTCYVYTEAYNLLREGAGPTFDVRTAVYDAVGTEVVSRDKPRKRTAESTVLVEGIPMDRLRTGTYTVAVSLLDTARHPIVTASRKFFVYNRTLGVDSSLHNLAGRVLSNEFASMDSAAIAREFAWLRYDAAPAEREQYGQLTTLDARRRFMAEYWSRRPPGLRDEYLRRVSYVNQAYSAFRREGYSTDRGRVHIVYGVPDEIERHPSEAESRPYEIWHYHSIQGGVLFVFVQRSSGGDYELVHSTHRNELRDDNWERYARAR